MLLIPYKINLKLNNRPVVTYVVIVLCLMVFALQLINRENVNSAVLDYCQTLNNGASLEHEPLDVLLLSVSQCATLIKSFNSVGGIERMHNEFMTIANENKEGFTQAEIVKYTRLIQTHYTEYLSVAPIDFEQQFVYLPDTFNPLRSLTSQFLHDGWLHLIGNLIFFLAFASAIECFVANAYRFTLLLIAIALCCSVANSVAALLTEWNAPSMGLSGVVMGMIGTSAAMMPKVQMRTLLLFLWRISVPVWVLAIWFVGWDFWSVVNTGDSSTRLSLVTHLAGGITGYLIGYLWCKRQPDITLTNTPI